MNKAASQTSPKAFADSLADHAERERIRNDLDTNLVVEAAAMCVKGEIDLVAGTSTTRNSEFRAFVEPR